MTTDALVGAYKGYYSPAGLTAPPVATVSVHVHNEVRRRSASFGPLLKWRHEWISNDRLLACGQGKRASDVVVHVFATSIAPPAAGALQAPLRQVRTHLQ